MPDKVALAHGDALQSLACIHWMRHQRGIKVLALIPDLGGPDDLEEIAEQAIDAGASSARITDLTRDFAERYLHPLLASGSTPHLANAIGRPPLAEELVRLAREESCQRVVLGAPITGGDLTRFRRAVSSCGDGEVGVFCPQEEWELREREALLDYARRHRLPVGTAAASGLSRDVNLWGARTRARRESAWDMPSAGAFAMTRAPADAPDEAIEIEIGFAHGRPSMLNGERRSLVGIVRELNQVGGELGVGRIDDVSGCDPAVIEVFEAPAAVILARARAVLTDVYLSRGDATFVQRISHRYAELVLDGRWWSTLRVSLDGFFETLLDGLHGRARLRLYKGSVSLLGRQLDPAPGD